MQKLVKYNPWSLLREMQEGVSPIFDRGLLLRDLQDNPSEISASDWSPRVDIHEKADKFVIVADLPGVDPKEIDVSMDNNALTIKGERNLERKVDEGDYSRCERFAGTFYRRFTLPDSIEPERIQAKGKNGVLEITIPKREQKVPKSIRVDVEA